MKRLFISTTILILLLIPQLAFSSDLDEFKAAVEKHYQAYNSMDADTIVEMEYPWTLMIESNALRKLSIELVVSRWAASITLWTYAIAVSSRSLLASISLIICLVFSILSLQLFIDSFVF